MNFSRKWVIAAGSALAVLIVAGVLVVVLRGGDEGGSEYKADINPAQFTSTITNPYFPLRPGSNWTYEERSGSNERAITEVTTKTEKIMGVDSLAVRNVARVGDSVIEDATDWYSQDATGNVWQMGEAVTEYRNGKPLNDAGSWKAGENGAEPTIIMKAQPQIGEEYWVEYLPGDTEVKAKVLSLTEQVKVPTGTYDNVLMTEETSPLEPAIAERKYYARGVGLVLAVVVRGENGRTELVAHTA